MVVASITALEQPMHRLWIDITAAALCVTVLCSCTTSKERLLPYGDRTMLDVWQQETAGNAGAGQTARQLLDARLLDARQALRRPLSDTHLQSVVVAQSAYTRTAGNEVQRQFHRLPNPDLVMYVFPHLAGSDPVPVPGYSTVFPLYQRVQYAMPGERVEDY
jgi:conjugative transfer region lipoprotein (TIGR03751 family)